MSRLPITLKKMTTLKHRLDSVQKTAVDLAIDSLKSTGRALIVMTTGTGKTITGSKIIEKMHGQKVLWLTQTEELITQTYLDLEAIFGPGEVGLYKRKKRSTQERVIVASLQTIEKEEYLKAISHRAFDLLIVDEAHHALASTWEKVIRYFHCKKLGLTATPHRTDGKDISELFGNATFHLGYEEAKSLNLIAHETYRVILTNSKVEGLVTRTGEYAPSALDRLIISENRNEIIVESYKKYGRGFMREHGLPYKALCFCITAAHAKRMRDLFRRHGISAELLISKHSTSLEHGSLITEKERKETYHAFVQGTGPEILCVVNVLNEGKNVPMISCLLMARPTRSSIIFQQQMGRGCRRVDGVKENYIVLDYVDLMNDRYPPITLARLSGEAYEPSQIITEYYRGQDPLVVDDYIHYLSPAYSFYPEPKWSKAKAAKALLEFFEKYGAIQRKDLITRDTGLPNATTIRRYWGSAKACFLDLGIPYKERIRKAWTKEEVVSAILEFKERHGSVGIQNFGSKNAMPSKKFVFRYWGSWKRCQKALGLDPWSKENILEAVRKYKKRNGRMPFKNEFLRKNELPSYATIKKKFRTLTRLADSA